MSDGITTVIVDTNDLTPATRAEVEAQVERHRQQKLARNHARVQHAKSGAAAHKPTLVAAPGGAESYTVNRNDAKIADGVTGGGTQPLDTVIVVQDGSVRREVNG